LGIKFEYHQHGKGTWHYSTKLGEIVFEIYPLMKNQNIPDKSLRLGFTVKNLDELILKLKKIKLKLSENRKHPNGVILQL